MHSTLAVQGFLILVCCHPSMPSCHSRPAHACVPQVERVALKVGGAKKMGAAGPATVTLTIASLPGIRREGRTGVQWLSSGVVDNTTHRAGCNPAVVTNLHRFGAPAMQQGVPVRGPGRPPGGPVAARESPCYCMPALLSLTATGRPSMRLNAAPNELFSVISLFPHPPLPLPSWWTTPRCSRRPRARRR